MDLSANAMSEAAEPEWIGRAPHEDFRAGVRPELPGDDPFYIPPAGYHHAAPGTVLRSRDVELALFGLIPQRAHATQLLYRSTDRHGAADVAATTVIVPTGAPADCPIVSYQCAIDAISARCFPSYALRRHAKAVGSVTQLELPLIAAVLAEGWAVSVPDHEGVTGMWGAPYEPGYHVLDGLRAVLNSDRLPLTAAAPIGLWGYSGGGLASSWAAEMCGTYAPELNIVGAVLGSPVGNLGNTFRRLNGGLFAGLPALVVAALADIYPGLHRVVEEHATEQGRELLDRLHHMSTAEAVIKLAGKNVDDMVDEPLEQILAMPEVTEVFDDIKLGVAVPVPPVLIVQAVHDEIISVDDIDELAQTYEAGGASVTYHRDLFSEHLLLHPMSAPMALRWLTDRFAQRPVTAHAVRSKWPTLLNPITYVGMVRLATVAVRVAMGRSVGRRPL